MQPMGQIDQFHGPLDEQSKLILVNVVTLPIIIFWVYLSIDLDCHNNDINKLSWKCVCFIEALIFWCVRALCLETDAGKIRRLTAALAVLHSIVFFRVLWGPFTGLFPLHVAIPIVAVISIALMIDFFRCLSEANARRCSPPQNEIDSQFLLGWRVEKRMIHVLAIFSTEDELIFILSHTSSIYI
jgi:hypothetical protein